MRNYTSPSQKIEMYSVKHNLSREEVKRILKTDDYLLSLEELKIKYDNPNIGKLPDWLNEEDFQKMIWNTVGQIYNNGYLNLISREDLFFEIYFHSLYTMNQMKNHKYLKGAMMNWGRSVLYYSTKKPWKVSYSTVLNEDMEHNTENSKITYADVLGYIDNNDQILLENIKSISDKYVRDIIIAIGYLVCDIDIFMDAYHQIIDKQEESVKIKLQKIENKMLSNDIVKLSKYIEEKDRPKDLPRLMNVKIQDVIAAFDLNKGIYEDYKSCTKCEKSNKVLEEIKYYLKEMHFA